MGSPFVQTELVWVSGEGKIHSSKYFVVEVFGRLKLTTEILDD